MRRRAALSARAFTLVELLVVILVIGILVAVAAPSFLGQTEKAHESAAKQHLAVAYKATALARTEGEGSYPAAAALAAYIGLVAPELAVSSGACAAALGGPDNRVVVSTLTTAVKAVLCAASSDYTVQRLTAPVNGALAYDELEPRIVFQSGRDGNQELYSMRYDGSDVKRLTNTPTKAEDQPALSPDGAKVLFERSNPGETHEIYDMSLDGSGLRDLTLTTYTANERVPTWTADGARIVYAAGSVLRVQDAAPGAATSIVVQTAGEVTTPSFTPAGGRLYFFSRTDYTGGPSELFWVGFPRASAAVYPDGFTRVTDDNGEEQNPDVSPDGTKLVWGSNAVNNGNAVSDFEIRVAALDAPAYEAGVALTNNSCQDTNPVWSPDGTKILFQSDCDGDWELFVMNADGSGRTQLTQNSSADTNPDW